MSVSVIVSVLLACAVGLTSSLTFVSCGAACGRVCLDGPEGSGPAELRGSVEGLGKSGESRRIWEVREGPSESRGSGRIRDAGAEGHE